MEGGDAAAPGTRAAPSPFRGYIPALDGLRGIAILSVMVHHFFLYGGGVPVYKLDRVLHGVALAGWSGVDLFFVLSGFLITGILYDTREQKGFFRTFYARRFLRIFPLYYGFLLICFSLLPTLARLGPTLTATGETQLLAWTYLTNFEIAFRGWDSVPAYLGHFWSLAIEEQFYLVWPLLVFLYPRRGLLRACAGMMVISVLLRLLLSEHHMMVAAYVLAPARMDTLAIGAGLALVVRDPDDLRATLRWAKPVLVSALLLLVGLYHWRHGLASEDPVVEVVGFTLLGCVFGAMVLLAVTSAGMGSFSRLLSSRPLRFFGKYSYALYVFHQPIALLLPMLGISAITLSPVAGLALPGDLAFTAVATGLSVAAALLSWHVYEQHFLRLKERFAYSR